MSTLPMTNGLQMSANDEFKAQYGKYWRRSAIIAVILMLLGALLSPNYVPNPYVLRDEITEVIDIPEQDNIEIPPPPVQAPPPPKVIEAAPDDEVADDVDMADTLMDINTAIGGSMGTIAITDDGFVASSTNPIIQVWAKPRYPEVARMAQVEGTVIVKVLVGPGGNVLQAVVIQSVQKLVDDAALAAAYKCKFIPGKQRDIPVKAWMALPFNFRLH